MSGLQQEVLGAEYLKIHPPSSRGSELEGTVRRALVEFSPTYGATGEDLAPQPLYTTSRPVAKNAKVQATTSPSSQKEKPQGNLWGKPPVHQILILSSGQLRQTKGNCLGQAHQNQLSSHTAAVALQFSKVPQDPAAG